MPLLFSTLDTLTLALTSGAIPATVAAAPVAADCGTSGATVVFAELSAAAKKRLRGIGVSEMIDDGRPRESFQNWLQLLPLVPQPLQVSDKTAVLFDVAGGGRFANLVAEMLRLGNDRQSYRHLSDGQAPRTLLRVLGPPYYTLLRSLEGGAGGLCAFAEQRPRIWVELGCEHPLADRVQVPAGQWLLLRAPRTWELLGEGPFEEIYQAIEFQLPAAESSWHDQPPQSRLSVPLRLTSMAETDPAELWVLEEDAWQQVEQLVAHSDNELIGRLAFAVVESSGPAARPLVLLRVRPSKLPPPVLILSGVACRSYLNLPNLFVPVGRRLHPPLRRDVVSKLLAADANRIVWLQPADGGGFVPRSVSDAAFRPLSQWVDYILDHEHQPLAAWMSAHRFDFAGFICHDDDAPARTKQPQQQRAKPPGPTKPQPGAAPSATTAPAGDEPILAEIVDEAQQQAAELVRDMPQPSELQRRLSAAESRFLALESPLDDAARLPLWREMAALNGALERRLDASLCWSQAVWESSSPSGDVATWLTQLSGGQKKPLPTAAELQRLLDDPTPERTAITPLVAQLVGQAAGLPDKAAATDQLALAARILTQHENSLPVRLVWLAWVALARLTHNDALALARARDRLLERLFQQGLTAEHDLPGFLRSGSGADASRHRLLRERLLALREVVAQWIPTEQTRVYADLILAYGLARLGETAEAQRIVAWARQQLRKGDGLHQWALAAYEFRIAEASQSKDGSQLSPALLAGLERMERVERYKADRLRQHSRIIEPYERIDPYRRWHRHYADDLARDLAQLFDVTSRDELRGKLNGLLANPPPAARTSGGQVRLLTTALELSPRLGEEFAAKVSDRILPAWNATDDVVERALLLEKALQVAAHFDQREAVQAFVERFERSLPEIVRGYLQLQADHSPERQEKLVAIESLFLQSLRGLRKLGLRDEIGRLFGQIVALVHAEAAIVAPTAKKGARASTPDTTRASKLLLAVAGGWFYFGQQEQALPVAMEVRRQLLASELAPLPRAALACAYLSAVGQAPLEIALRLIQELFETDPKTDQPSLPPVQDTLTTSSHFSLAQLDIVEATVLTLVSDDSVLSPETRRWLEEDEYLVRRRIHRDVREMMGA